MALLLGREKHMLQAKKHMSNSAPSTGTSLGQRLENPLGSSLLSEPQGLQVSAELSLTQSQETSLPYD